MTRTLSIRLVPEAAQAELVFRYDEEIVAVIRALRQRRWHPARRLWTVARSEIDGLCRELERHGVRVTVQRESSAPRRERSMPTVLAISEVKRAARPREPGHHTDLHTRHSPRPGPDPQPARHARRTAVR
jgi:hypothetical protein